VEKECSARGTSTVVLSSFEIVANKISVQGASALDVAAPQLGHQNKEKRASTHLQRDCFNYGNWVSQYSLEQAVTGSDSFCYEAGLQIQGKSQVTWSMSKAWYFNTYDNKWEQFVATNNGQAVQVYFEVSQWHNWFDGFWCGEMFKDIIYGCGGSNPDSAGGQWHWVDDAPCTTNCNQMSCSCNPVVYPKGPWFTDNYLGKFQPYS
jgi:hypothetical protein